MFSKSFDRIFKLIFAVTFVMICTGCGGGGSSETATGSPNSVQRPCDIYQSTTACVAAYSTVRSLYATYLGPLYQVRRISDNAKLDIGLLPDGYANSADQDNFCANTTCVIRILYDQSNNRNDLTVAPPGGQASGPGANGYDIAATADALPVMAGGHKVYGISIVPGMGYRNDNTVGVAMKGQAEGVYMVSSTIGINSLCCFDFGNAETTNNDDKAGHMDAINIYQPATAPGVFTVNLDVEDGLKGFLTILPSSKFVTAMGSNDGQNSFSIWAGDAQNGALTSTGTRALPAGYAPMQQEGAIILGIGGDNSNRAYGYFFEGAMTIGTPTNDIMNAVQQNIVGAGYSGL